MWKVSKCEASGQEALPWGLPLALHVGENGVKTDAPHQQSPTFFGTRDRCYETLMPDDEVELRQEP